MNAQVNVPRHLRVVGLVLLAWNGFGAVQWYRQVTRSEGYWGNLTLEQVQYLQMQPMWVEVAFGVGVWTGVLGALMLIMRRKLAFNAFVASLIAVLASSVYVQALSNGRAVMGNGTLVAAIAVVLVAAVSVVYAHKVRKQGLIR